MDHLIVLIINEGEPVTSDTLTGALKKYGELPSEPFTFDIAEYCPDMPSQASPQGKRVKGVIAPTPSLYTSTFMFSMLFAQMPAHCNCPKH